MQFDMITPLIERFNNLIDSLIKDFEEYNLDGETIIFLAKKTKNFINFTELALLTVIFKILEKMSDVTYQFDEEIKEANQMIDKIFEELNKSVEKILEQDNEEEHDHHHHGHGHHHHEHHDIDVDILQEPVEKIKEYLDFLKKLMGNIGDMVIKVLKYQNKEIIEEEFKGEYNSFKENMKKFKEEFESIVKNLIIDNILMDPFIEI